MATESADHGVYLDLVRQICGLGLRRAVFGLRRATQPKGSFSFGMHYQKVFVARSTTPQLLFQQRACMPIGHSTGGGAF